MRTALVFALAFLVPTSALALPKGELPKRDRLKPIPGEPGSGAPIKKQLRPTDSSKLSAPLPKRPRSEKEQEGIDEMERLMSRYRQAFDAQAHTVGQMLVVTGTQGRRALEQRYDRQIRDHAAKARKLRAQAVKRYEDFLKLHPDDATWTPEIMFRLAELHFEAGNDRLARQEDAFQKELEAYQERLKKDKNAPAPPSPVADYTESIAMYRRVVEDFPKYHLGDAALYMMGTLLYEMEEFDQSRQSYLALACANKYEPPAVGAVIETRPFAKGDYADCQPWSKDSKYASEAWLRTGEVHYDFDELEPALAAYEQAASDPEADLYDEALIRMAWTLYLMRRFPRAAKTFDDFIKYADEHKDDKESGAIALRDDAVKYLAKTYAEEDWDRDGLQDRFYGFSRLDRDYRERGKERHVPEVYAALGDLLAEATDYTGAIRIWEATLARWPLAPAAPKIQMRIMLAHNMLQDKAAATRARDLLATNYLRGTKWFYANENDPDVIEEALKLAEEALVHTALDHHQLAQELRSNGDPKATEEYRIAARAYEAYLERFPDTQASYEYRYNFADALFFSGQYLKAVEQYNEVRDSNIDNRLQEDAASGSVLAVEAYVEQEQQAGRLQVPDMPQKGMEGPFDKPKNIPAIMVTLRGAYDRFVEVRPDSDQAATMKYLAGQVSQRYHHFDDAEKRFVEVVENHCEENVSINAGKAILAARVVREDLAGAKAWTEKLMKQGCGEGEEKQKFAGDLKEIGNAVRFQEATLLYEAGEFEAAADRYVALVDQAPDDPSADKALNNAAVSYENIGRFGSASQTYKRIYTSYPDSDFADDALLRTGYNHARFFEFEQAVVSYLILAEDKRYQDSEHRDKALKNTADLLDNLQQYKRSAEMYKRHAAKTEDKDMAAESTFRAAEVLGKTEDKTATITAYQSFIGHYGSQPKHAERVVQAHLAIGHAYDDLGNRKRAEEYYKATVAQFSQKGLKPATDAADYPSEAQFLVAENALKEVLKSKLTSTKPKKLEAEAKRLFTNVDAAAKGYASVFPYRRIEWVLAAMYRRGFAFETTAINMRTAPVPKKLKQYSEPWFAYKDMIDQEASKFEAEAIRLYEETVKRGKEYNIANEWTRGARERLNIYKPEEYPLLRQPAMDLELGELR